MSREIPVDIHQSSRCVLFGDSWLLDYFSTFSHNENWKLVLPSPLLPLETWFVDVSCFVTVVVAAVVCFGLVGFFLVYKMVEVITAPMKDSKSPTEKSRG